MEYQEIIRSSIIALKTNALRTGLTMLGIIIGISSVILIASVGQGAVAFITNELSSFGTNYFQIAPGANIMSTLGGATGNPLTLEESNAIEAAGIENIESVAPIGLASRAVSANDKETSVLIYGVTETGQSMLKPELIFGELLTDADNGSRVVVMGVDTAKDLFGEGINPVGESVRIDGVRFRVIGVTKSSGMLTGGFFNSALVVPLEVLSDQIRGDNELVEIDVSVFNTDYINQTMDDVEVFLRDRRNIGKGEDSDFNMTSFLESLSIVNTVTTLLTTLIAGVSSISLIVGGVGVMNIMLVSVTERTREIGLLKAIGAKENDILIQFLIESVVMSLFGGIIGILLGVGGAYIVSLVAPIPFVLSVFWIVIAMVVSTIVGVVFGLYPARRAASLAPIDALRYE